MDATDRTKKDGVLVTNKAKLVEVDNKILDPKRSDPATTVTTNDTRLSANVAVDKKVTNDSANKKSTNKQNVSGKSESPVKSKSDSNNKIESNTDKPVSVPNKVVEQNSILLDKMTVATPVSLTTPNVVLTKVNESALGPVYNRGHEDVSRTQNKPSIQEPVNNVHISSSSETCAPTAKTAEEQHLTSDDFVMIDAGIEPFDEPVSGSVEPETHPADEATESAVEKEISECYDSDMDLENLDSSPAVSSQLKLLKFTSKLSSLDGSGYIYAFTDSSNDAKNHRIKIGASRQPYKKLQQATLFNVDIKLVSAVRVGRRKLALVEILGQLERYIIVDAKYWFLGPLDDMLQILMETCMNYPLHVEKSPSSPLSPRN